MNNNQDIFNNNPQQNNQNRFINNVNNQNPNGLEENQITNSQDNDMHQFDQAFMNRFSTNDQPSSQNNIETEPPVNNNQFNQPISTPEIKQPENNIEEENPMLNLSHNKFIQNDTEHNNAGLNNLNVNGEYYDMPKVDYSQDPKVQENLKKKNTVTITSEGKVFIIIILVLMLFIFAMPYIFETIRNVTYQ